MARFHRQTAMKKSASSDLESPTDESEKYYASVPPSLPRHRRSDLHRRFRIEFTFEKATALPACSTATVFLSRGTTTYTTNLVNVSGGVAGNAL